MDGCFNSVQFRSKHFIFLYSEVCIQITTVESFPYKPSDDISHLNFGIRSLLSSKTHKTPENQPCIEPKLALQLLVSGGCREPVGQAKADSQCNFGYEMPHGEIAGFQLHR